MSSIPRASALKLASTAHDLGAEALRGILEQDESGRWTVGHIEVESWLSRLGGQEVVLAVAAIDDKTQMVDGDLLDERLLLKHAVGWENVLDAADTPIPFTHDALFRLPHWVIDGLIAKILTGVVEEQEEQKNSEGSSTT